MNSTPVRFSVLLPTHNQAALLELAIESILLQTFEDFEVLVVADGCTDETAEVVRAIRDSRVRLFDLPKAPGFGYANRNTALKQARGELIAYLAHDDLFTPDHLEIMDGVFQEPETWWAYSRPVIVEADGVYHASFQNLNVPLLRRKFVKRSRTVPACTVVYRRECHERFGYWDETIHHAGDRELWSRYLQGAGCEAMRFISRPTTLHFRAPWRHILRNPGGHYRNMLEPYPDAWPLHEDVEGAASEQEAFLTRIKADPRGWIRRFERDVQATLDGRLFAFHRAEKRRQRAERKERAEPSRPPSVKGHQKEIDG